MTDEVGKHSKWTPGPWHYSGPGSKIPGEMSPFRAVFAKIDDKYWCVASVTGQRYTYVENGVEAEDVREEREANAKLISKAPELAEALRALLQLIDEGFLVRDIRGDDDPAWAIKAFPKLQVIGRAEKLLSEVVG